MAPSGNDVGALAARYAPDIGELTGNRDEVGQCQLWVEQQAIGA